MQKKMYIPSLIELSIKTQIIKIVCFLDPRKFDCIQVCAFCAPTAVRLNLLTTKKYRKTAVFD